MRLLTFVLMLGLGFIVGCSRNSGPPPPLAAAELPAAFGKAFGTAKPEAKALANQVVAAVQAQDYSKAFNDLQMLINRADLTKDQMSVATRGVATVQTLLQSAQTQGDAKAAETLKTYQSTK